MAEKALQIRLLNITVRENGVDTTAVSASVINATLTYPTAGTPERTTSKVVKLADNQLVDYTGVNANTGKPYTWADRILFKEKVDGATQLAISVTTVQKTSATQKFFAGLFGAVFEAAWGLATGGITNVLIGAAVGAVGKAHVKSFELKDEAVRTIGEAAIDLDETTTGVHTLNLVAAENILAKRFAAPPGGTQPQIVQKQVLAKGDPNGMIQIEITPL